MASVKKLGNIVFDSLILGKNNGRDTHSEHVMVMVAGGVMSLVEILIRSRILNRVGIVERKAHFKGDLQLFALIKKFQFTRQVVD
mmetsp:Transcript_16438/g.23179  ORF Transcript_16438/g.23179 Transcript_16438/m.23179 type:complete len:85 (+) Transcript_16438:240-494(+)